MIFPPGVNRSDGSVDDCLGSSNVFIAVGTPAFDGFEDPVLQVPTSGGSPQASVHPRNRGRADRVADDPKSWVGRRPKVFKRVGPRGLDSVAEALEEDPGHPDGVFAGWVDLEAELGIVIEQSDSKCWDRRRYGGARE
jgi:hypothetical protein